MRLSTFGILCWSAQAQPIMEDGDACTPWENGALPCGRDLQCVATWNNDGDGSYNDPICYPADTMFTMDHTDAGTCAANEDCAPTFWCDTDHDPPACESVLRDDDPVEPPVTEDPEGAALEGQPCTPWDHGSTPCAGRMQCVGAWDNTNGVYGDPVCHPEDTVFTSGHDSSSHACTSNADCEDSYRCNVALDTLTSACEEWLESGTPANAQPGAACQVDDDCSQSDPYCSGSCDRAAGCMIMCQSQHEHPDDLADGEACSLDDGATPCGSGLACTADATGNNLTCSPENVHTLHDSDSETVHTATCNFRELMDAVAAAVTDPTAFAGLSTNEVYLRCAEVAGEMAAVEIAAACPGSP